MKISDNLLSLGAKNSTVYAFRELLENNGLEDASNFISGTAHAIANNFDFALSATSGQSLSVEDSVDLVEETAYDMNFTNDVINSYNVNTPTRRIAEFTTELYDKAMASPEINSVSLEYAEDTEHLKHGKFTGGNVYKDYEGNIESSDAKEQYGWMTPDNSSTDYCLFTNGVSSFIIAVHDFSPEPLIADFTPLYNKLKDKSKYNNDVLDDIHQGYSLAMSYRNQVASVLSTKKKQLWDIYMKTSSTVDRFKSFAGERGFGESIKEQITSIPGKIESTVNSYIDSFVGIFTGNGVAPPPIKDSQIAHKSENTSNDGNLTRSITDVQAVIYDMPNGINSSEEGSNKIFCLQQPENISYSASAAFDSPSPRGAQQPFRFYQGANGISLSFTLKFHIDEVREYKCLERRGTDTFDLSESVSLQDIANMAEDFTRPWEFKGSIEPKLIKVILPGISEYGYMSQAQISYSGDMTYTDMYEYGHSYNNRLNGINLPENMTREEYTNLTYGSDVSSEDRLVNSEGSSTTYTYSQLDISFELQLLRDVTLQSKNSSSDKSKSSSTSNSSSKTSSSSSQSSSNKPSSHKSNSSGNSKKDDTNFDFTDPENSSYIPPSYEDSNTEKSSLSTQFSTQQDSSTTQGTSIKEPIHSKSPNYSS